MKIRYVEPLSAGKILGAIYGALGLLIGAVFTCISLIAAAVAANQAGPFGAFPAVMGLFAVVFFPVFYGVAGFIGGVITAFLYNVAAQFVGGIEVDLVP
jgi:hypothetical protein